MSDDKTFDPGADRVGPSGPPIENLSGSVKTIGSTRRYNRDPGGRFAIRKQAEVGPLGPPGGVGPGGLDTVTGHWIPGVKNNSQSHDWERVHAVSVAPYYTVPNFSGHPPVSAQFASAYDGLSHAGLDLCPTCGQVH